MPDAIITSTESTFGTISGTFSADQSTITGTVAGSVVGNLSGSVGVPGPAGAAGPGVPAGGTAGQYLQKIDGVDYNTDWVTLNLSAYAPLNSPAFTGDPTAPTAALGDNDTSLATTAFVQQELASGVAVAKNLEVLVRNQSGSTIAAGAIVYISGATGNKPLITLAQANNDANSAQTMGFVKTAIANNGFGYVIVRGEVENLDTSALTEGVQLYLSPTTAGAWTTTKPSAPQHLVYVGIVIRSHPTQGVILVAVQNGYELNELHDVAISSPTNGQVLKYNSSTGLWYNGTDSSGVAWGSITGTLSSQTDLQTALDGKYSTSNPAGYITSSALSPYLTSATAASTYQTISGMSSYLTTSAAASTYYLQTNPAGYITSSALSPYLTSAAAASTYFTIASAANKADLASPTFTGVPAAPTASPGTNTTQIATTAFVTAAVSASTGATWGSITGTLSSQTDLQSALDAKLSTATAASTYQTLSGMSSYLTTSSAASTYQTISGMSSYLTTATAASTYAPLASPALTGNPTAPTPATADNDTSIATTAFVKAQGYLTSAPVTSVAGKTGAVTLVVGDVSGAAPLASPTFTGTPAAPTATAGTNTTQIATTAFVTAGLNLKANLASPTFTGTPAAPTASAGTSTTQLATTAFVTTADNLKANLASPAFTGTPTAPTATAGTNTTQIATTAFVTAAVPAAATHIQSLQFSSTSAYTRVIDASSQLIAPSVLRIWPSPSNYNGTSTSGAGASALPYLTGYVLTSPSAGVAGNARAFHGNIAGDLAGMMWGGSNNTIINFSRRVSMAFRFSQFPSSTSSVTRVLLGKIHGTAVGDLTSRGIGVKYVPNGSNFDFQLQVHNGTTLTSVTSSTQYAGGVADLEVVSDGSGNAVLYLNGNQVASTTGAPTGNTSNNATVFAEIESQSTTSNQPVANIGRLYVNTLNF